MFGSRFIEIVRNVDFGVRYKLRLVGQNYIDRYAAAIATESPYRAAIRS